MKAVIMAGGLGSRLKAVTGSLPKPLAPLLGRPMMEHIILLLKEQGFTDICAAVKYRAEDIIERFGDGSALGVRLQYRVEEQPLGTAGAVKNCEDFYGGEDFLVISGDAACDFDLSRLMAEHKRRRAAATIALCCHPEPLRYGLAITDQGDMVRAFIEKPSWAQVVTDHVNTGIYLLSPRAMAPVPRGQSFDFARDLFPLLLERGELILGLPMEGYWQDVGTPLSYYKCCADALEGKLRLQPGPEFAGREEDQAENEPEGDWAASLEYPCKSRAGLMAELSKAMLDMGASFSDGLRLSGENYALRISPLAKSSAIRISVASEDAEFAKELAISARDLAKALDL